jgi:hypothetical protein
MLEICFYPEEGDIMFLRNIVILYQTTRRHISGDMNSLLLYALSACWHARNILLPWRRRHYIPTKHCYTCIRTHGVTSQTIWTHCFFMLYLLVGMLKIFFFPEDRDIIFIRNIVKLIPEYTASHFRRYELIAFFMLLSACWHAQNILLTWRQRHYIPTKHC